MRTLRPRRVLAAGAAVLAVVLAILWFVPSNYYVYLPDPARPVDPLIRVPHEDEGSSKGGIYMVDVSIRKASLLERLVPAVDSGATLVPASDFLSPGTSEREQQEQSLEEMRASQAVAKAVALRALGYRVPSAGAVVVIVSSGFPADGVLEKGDLVVRLDGHRIRTPEDVTAAMERVEPGDRIALVVRRDGKRKRLEVGTRAAAETPTRPVMGVLIEPKLHFPLDVRIDAGTIGGPSAGLAFALDIVDELGHDLDHGRRVVVTGALALSGRVLEIGGIKQKTLGARDADADLFLVPKANAAEARRYAGPLRVVAVGSFEQAMSYLATG